MLLRLPIGILNNRHQQVPINWRFTADKTVRIIPSFGEALFVGSGLKTTPPACEVQRVVSRWVSTSVAILAEISLRSHQKLSIFIIKVLLTHDYIYYVYLVVLLSVLLLRMLTISG